VPSLEEEKAAPQSASVPKDQANAGLESQPNVHGAPEQPPAESAEKPTATISGNVKKEWDGPLGGAKLTVGGSEGLSDADGKYSLSVPIAEPKTLTLDISCLGFQNQSKQIEISPNDQLTLDFLMGKGRSSLEGTVCDEETGLPISNAYVSIDSQKMYTSADGRFAFAEIEANRRYPLTAYKDGYETKSLLADWVEPGKPLTCQIKLMKKKPEEKKDVKDEKEAHAAAETLPTRRRTRLTRADD
jgi:hypothetical protein